MSEFLSTLERLLERRRGLDVTADLSVTVDGDPVRIESYTDRVFVDLPSFGAARRLYARHGDEHERLTGLLVATDLTLVVRVDGRRVAFVGSEATPGVVERRLGLEATSLDLPGLLLAALLAR